MDIQHFFDPATWTLSYVVSDPATRDAVVIDPVLNFDPVGLIFSEASMDEVMTYAEDRGLTIRAVLETHIHADHVTAAHRLRARVGALVVAGSSVSAVQATFKELLALDGQATDGTGFDVLLGDDQLLDAGSLSVKALHTPGHTPACTSYLIGDAVFVGDTMFMPDFGTGRCDFPEGSATDLFDSVTEKLYSLPDSTRVFVGHDYQPGGRTLQFETTIGASKAENIQLKGDTSRAEFISWRSERDATLPLPNLIFQSVQLNINAGAIALPEKGLPYLKLPILGT